MRVAFHTLGCKVNQYESEALSEAFVRMGAEIVPEDECADVYIVNTCTVTNIADRKSRQFIRRMKSINQDALMVVTGCYAQVSQEALESMPDVDMIVGNSLKSEIPKMVAEALAKRESVSEHTEAKLLNIEAEALAKNDDSSKTAGLETVAEVLTKNDEKTVRVLDYDELTDYEDMGIVTSSESGMTRAYIKIQEGCNRFCSYCLIPYARGRVRSRDMTGIVAEAEMLLAKGFKEIVLTGINTALYGTEPGFDFERLPGEEEMSGLEAVIRRLDAIDGDFRIRLSSLEPTVVDIEHIEKIIGYGKLCHHLHLSVQAGSDAVLEAMNRHYSRADYLAIVQALRERDPLYGITTDIIVGFPGESDEDYERTLDIVPEAAFGRVHVFRYSPRKGTKAVLIGDNVPPDVKAERASRLEAEAARVQRLFNAANVGTMQRVLCEEIRDGYVTGYTDNYIKGYVPVDGENLCGSEPRGAENCGVACDQESRNELTNCSKLDGERLVGEFVNVMLEEVFRDGCLARIIKTATSDK